jgi:spore coat assembly protein SafA
MSVDVRVNGTTYNLFKQLDLTTSLDEMLRETRIIVSEQVNDSSFIIEGDLIEVWLDSVKAFTGYTDSISENESDTSHDIEYRARSKAMDVVDSSVPDNVKFVKGVLKYADLWNLCIKGLGITDISVIDEIGATFSPDDKGAEIGQKCGEFLQKYARKVSVFPVSNGDGDIIMRTPTGKLKTMLLQIKDGKNNNIINSTYNNDISERFSKYIVRSNSNLTSSKTNGKDLKKNMNAKGEYIDDTIRSTRIFEKIAESPMTSSECQKAAEEEANIRKIRGFNYSCEVAGFSGNGELWEDGLLASVKDIKKGVQGDFLIKDVHYSYSINGEKTFMNLTYPDAYGALAKDNTYTVVKGDALYKIAKEQGVLLQELIQANPQIKNPDLIYPDQQVNIPVRSIK